MNILILGGAGYLGSVLVGKLLDRYYKVTAYDNLMYNQQSLLQYISHPNFKFVWGNVEDFNDELADEIEKSDFIFPLACIVGAPATNRSIVASYAINESFIYELVDCCLAWYGKQKIIFPTTNSGYGTKSGDVYCTEETILEPISFYGKQKVIAENFLLSNYDNVITLRLAIVFGVSPRMRLDLLINFFVWKAVTEGVITVAEPNQKRNYIHIQDVADCFVHCIDNFDDMKGNTYNLGLNENHSKGELVEIIQSLTGCEVLETTSYKDPDRRNYVVSNDKINKTGFIPKITVEEVIPELISACKMLRMLNHGRDTNRNY